VAALDGKTYALDESMCVIADDAGALGIAGIIGGEATGCTPDTVNVFIECAWFDPAAIATTGRRLGIVSDARYRFERTVDPQSVIPGIELATKMITELCGGIAHEVVVAGRVGAAGSVIDFPLSELGRLTGLELPDAEIVGALERLGFSVAGSGDVRQVGVPSWRPDVTQKADLAEEAMRIIGVDKVPVEPLPRLANVAPRMLTTLQNRRRLARRVLAARGLDEAVNWSFVPARDAGLFGGGAAELKLANPIAADLTDMRPSLLPGLIAAAKRNANRGYPDLGLFEVGQVFHSVRPEGQRTYASALRTGTATPDGPGRNWRRPLRTVDVFDAKSDLAALLEAIGHDIDKLQVVAEPPAWSHPGRGGAVKLGPKVTLGWFGEVHPAVLGAFDADGPVAAFEFDLDALPEPRRRGAGKPPLRLNDLMPLTRDFAFVVEREVTAGSLLKAARNADKALITEAGVFDVFEGPHLGPGKKSVAIAVTLQPRDRTLTDEEIDKVSRAIIAAVEKATGGVLRT
jgi:phenylalanyl-tRNA synthetase beta chain